MTRSDQTQSRGDHGNCDWHESEPYKTRRTALDNEVNPADPDDPTPLEVAALEYMDAIMEEARSSDGFSQGRYDAPMGREVKQRNMPWIGEIKTPGAPRRSEGGKREYRLYFAEPDIDDALLAASLDHKTANQMKSRRRFAPSSLSSLRQTSQIVTAAGIIRRWCSNQGVTFRTIN